MSETTNEPQDEQVGPDAVASPELVHQEGSGTLLAAEDAGDVETMTSQVTPGERNEPV